jgi:hypothetical protein
LEPAQSGLRRSARTRSSDLLSKVARELGQVDFFIHDSLHTYRNIHHELEIVIPFLAPRAVVVVADDVKGNAAFDAWVSRVRPSYSAILREHSKENLLGVAVLPALSPRVDE